MKQIKIFFVFLIMISIAVSWTKTYAQDALSIIVNPENPITTLSRADLKKIYKGTKKSWDDGSKIVALLPRREPSEFYDLINMSKSQYDKHRIKASLSGSKMPLKRVNNDAAVVLYIKGHKDSIGCVRSGVDLTGAKVIKVSY